MQKNASPGGRARLLVVIIGLVAGLQLSLTPFAFAHANVVRSQPAANSVLEQYPPQVVIWFTEPLAPQFGEIQVLDSQGERVDSGDSVVDSQDPTVMSVSLPPLPNGTYVVAWTNVSTIDGHKVRGSFLFSVGEPLSETSVADTSKQPLFQSPLEPALRGLTLLSIMALVGGLGFEMLILQPVLKREELAKPFRNLGEQLASRTLKLIWAAMGLLLVTSITHLLFQTMITYELPLFQIFIGPLTSVLMGTSWGFFLLWRLGLLLLMPAVLDLALIFPLRKQNRDSQQSLSRRLSRILALTAGGGMLLTLSLTGHAAATAGLRAAAVFNDYLHLLAASFWVGGLFHFALGAPLIVLTLSKKKQRAVLAAIVPRFSTLAALSVTVLIVTGLYSSWAQVTIPAAVVTPYGLTLAAKLGLVTLLLVFAALNLLWVKPRLAREEAAGHWLRRLVAGEAILAALTLLAVGVLISLEPARQVASREGIGQERELIFQDIVEGVNVVLSIEPAQVGPNKFIVSLENRRGRPITNAAEVSLRLDYLETDLGESTITTTSIGDGTYVAEGALFSLSGPWQAALVVRRPDALDARTAFRFEVASRGAAGSATIAPSPKTGNILWGVELALLGFVFVGTGLPHSRWRSRRGAVVTFPGLVALLVGIFLAANTQFTGLDAPEVAQENRAASEPAVAVAAQQINRESDAQEGPLRNPFPPNPTSLAAGQRVFDKSCPLCHGLTGRGDGPRAEKLYPRPVDLLVHIPLHPEAGLFRIVRDGVRDSAMPSFGDVLSDEEIWHLVNYLRVFEVDQRLAEDYFHRGMAFAAEGDYERAITNLDEALELSPKHVSAYNGRGTVYRRLGEYERAIADHSQAIELKPDFSAAYFDRAVTYNEARNPSQAILDYTKAIELEPGFRAYYGRGLAQADVGRLDQAILDFNKTVELQPDFSRVYLDRGLAHLDAGDVGQAGADLKRYLELAPAAENRQAIENLISELHPPSASRPTQTSPVPAGATLMLEDFPPGFEALPPAEMGFITGGTIGDGSIIETSFAFGQLESPELVWGFTTLMPSAPAQTASEAEVRYSQALLASFLEEIGITDIVKQEELPAPAALGDLSAGLRVTFGGEDSPTRLDAVHFRLGTVGAFIFALYPDGDVPAVSIGDLAQALNERIGAYAASGSVP